MKLALSAALLWMFCGVPPQTRPNPGGCDHAAPPAGMRWSCAADNPCDCHLVPAGPGAEGGLDSGGISESGDHAKQCLACNVEYFVVPDYPAAAIKAGRQGNVSASLVLTAEGAVQQVQIASGDPELAKAASAALRQWRFTPGMRVRLIPVGVKFVLADHASGSVTGTSLLNLIVSAKPMR